MSRILRVLAPNPGVRELEGTNTWVVGENPAIVIDPGPEHEGHARDVAREAGRVGAILLTHDHPDHAEGAEVLATITDVGVTTTRGGAGFGGNNGSHAGQVRVALTPAARRP